VEFFYCYVDVYCSSEGTKNRSILLFWKKWHALTIRGASEIGDRKKVGNPCTRLWAMHYFPVSRFISKASTVQWRQQSRFATWQTHAPHDHVVRWQSQLHSYYRKWQAEQVTTPQERRPTGICPGTPSLQHRQCRCRFYTYDLPTTISRKYAYDDDQATMHADGDCQAVEGALTKDMATVGEYLHTWKLNLSTTKTVPAVFHLNNKEAKCELKVNFNNETLPYCSEPKYLGVTLDRSFTYRRHL